MKIIKIQWRSTISINVYTKSSKVVKIMEFDEKPWKNSKNLRIRGSCLEHTRQPKTLSKTRKIDFSWFGDLKKSKISIPNPTLTLFWAPAEAWLLFSSFSRRKTTTESPKNKIFDFWLFFPSLITQKVSEKHSGSVLRGAALSELYSWVPRRS